MDNFVNTSSEEDSDYNDFEFDVDSILKERIEELENGFITLYRFYVKQIKILKDAIDFDDKKIKTELIHALETLKLKKSRAYEIMMNIKTILNVDDEDGIEHGLGTPLKNIVLKNNIAAITQVEMDKMLLVSRYCLEHQILSCPCIPTMYL